MGNYPTIVLDFETTGLSPQYGDRAIEIGAVLIEDNMIVNRFQGLMNPGFRISSFIESYTGISNSMVEAAAPCEEIMEQFSDFVGDYPLVAHNASFDTRFLDSEFQFIGKTRANPIACSMLVSRRIYPHAFNHKLGTLVDYCCIENDGTFHRALADAEMTGHLWISMIKEIKKNYGLKEVPFELMQKISKICKAKVSSFLKKESGRQS